MIKAGFPIKSIHKYNGKELVIYMDMSNSSGYSLEDMATTKSKHFLFHHLLQQFQSIELKDCHLLVCVSGGVDSMVLLSVLLEVKRVLNLMISAVHVHHGAEKKEQKKFQDQAAVTVKKFCVENSIKCYGNEAVCSVNGGLLLQKKRNHSNVFFNSCGNEAEMRKYRYRIFSDCIKKSKADYLVLAHTADDLLETRLIRLIRGTGEQGLMAMSFRSDILIRPFIHISRSQIVDYARQRKLKWCEDPSNQAAEYSFRNWIRHEWLPQLEKKRPGSVEAISRSLNLIARTASNDQQRIRKICQSLIKNQSLRRDFISTFSLADKKKILAYYIKKRGLKNYRASHILELLKQMNRLQKNFTFSLLGETWKMGPHWLSSCKKKQNHVKKDVKL